MKAKIEVDIKPFNVPNFAVIKDENNDSQGIPLAALSLESLAALCDDFRTAVFEKAGVPVPDPCVEERASYEAEIDRLEKKVRELTEKKQVKPK